MGDRNFHYAPLNLCFRNIIRFGVRKRWLYVTCWRHPSKYRQRLLNIQTTSYLNYN